MIGFGKRTKEEQARESQWDLWVGSGIQGGEWLEAFETIWWPIPFLSFPSSGISKNSLILRIISVQDLISPSTLHIPMSFFMQSPSFLPLSVNVQVCPFNSLSTVSQVVVKECRINPLCFSTSTEKGQDKKQKRGHSCILPCYQNKQESCQVVVIHQLKSPVLQIIKISNLPCYPVFCPVLLDWYLGINSHSLGRH